MDDFTLQFVGEYYSADGNEASYEVRLWHESGELIAVAYAYQAAEGWTHGYATVEQEHVNDDTPIYGDWRYCLLDQVTATYDMRTREAKAIKAEILGG